ncbi:MAG TPA: ABC transporter substrate-binding protein, partial [Clostridiales bacterium]|nr:ABC transporter substrate-binding protein [Clostridiales bacterium]
MKKVLSVLLGAALIAVLLAGCGTQGTSSKENTSGGVFRVGMEAAYAPFNWTQNDNSNGGVRIEGTSEYAGGYDVEIAKKVAEGLGKELVIVKTEWGGLLPSLTSGTIDAIVAGMSPTEERKEAIDFSDNYYKSDLVMVVKRGGKYEQASSIQDFKNARVTGQLNTSHYKVIDQIDGVIKETAMDDFTAMRVALESGIIDGYVSERPEGISATAANKSLVMLEFTEGFEVSDEDAAVAVGLKKGSELTEKINEILAGISESQRQEI